MNTLKRLINLIVVDWLDRFVDLGEPAQTQRPIANPHRRALEYMVLTPALEQMLDQAG